MGTTNTTHSSEQYAYQDATKEEGEGITAKSVAAIDEASSAELNPAYYPKHNKPEALHNEAEKAGADFPGRDPAAAASGKDSDGEDLEEGVQDALMSGGAPGAVGAGQGAGQEPGDEQHPPGSQAAEGGNVAPGAVEDSGDVEDTEDVEDSGEEELNDEEVENVLSGTVGEVEAYAAEYPETVKQLLKAEKKGRNRSTLIKALEEQQAQG